MGTPLSQVRRLALFSPGCIPMAEYELFQAGGDHPLMNWPAAILKVMGTSLLAVFTVQFDACRDLLHSLGVRGGEFQAYYVVFCSLIALGYIISFVGFASYFMNEEVRCAIGVGKGFMLIIYDLPKLITVMCLLHTTGMTSGNYLVSSMAISAAAKAFSVFYAGRRIRDHLPVFYAGDGHCDRPDPNSWALGLVACLCCVCPIFAVMLVANSRQCGDSNCPSIEDMQCA